MIYQILMKKLSVFIGRVNSKASDIYNQYFKDEEDPNTLIQVKYAKDDENIENPHHEEFQLSLKSQPQRVLMLGVILK